MKQLGPKPVIRTMQVRYLGYSERDYVIEISAAGIRVRKKGTRTWFGPATWEQILNSAFRVSVRQNDIEKARVRKSA